MEAPNRVNTEQGELKEKLEGVIEKAKAVCERLQEQTTAAAKAADKTIREHPYHAGGVAFGMGVLKGVLVMRSRND